jgi:hypothetical protein
VWLCSFPLAGNSPKKAVKAFLEPLKRVVSCFSATAHLAHSGSYEINGDPSALFIERFKLPGADLYLSASMNYKIVEAAGDRGPYKVKTTAYQYILEDEDEKEILAYQWHPESRVQFPHIHVGSSSKIAGKTFNKIHLPTGRIALEQVLRITVDELGVKPLKGEWNSILVQTQKLFEKWRTWP